MWLMNSSYGSEDFWPSLEKELNALIEDEPNLIANLANLSSWIYHCLPNLNWCGFYLWDGNKGDLVLGPFQGKPACVRIGPTRGVCGAAYTQKKTLRVDDVFEFPGHIACDSASRSELVVPLVKDGIVQAILDLDSPDLARFTLTEERALTQIMAGLSEKLNWNV